ncbi:U2 snRNP auxiliary factor large subunit [Intoshia linei]|uniref:Splicing factor U2AF subunit n=1 Tax=Intoshia linei TaxID=1819745 RepID=A0A177AZS5_9BILA|nr:U2 snRNP auxiliary factor large subunit [Intoshia linei]
MDKEIKTDMRAVPPPEEFSDTKYDTPRENETRENSNEEYPDECVKNGENNSDKEKRSDEERSKTRKHRRKRSRSRSKDRRKRRRSRERNRSRERKHRHRSRSKEIKRKNKYWDVPPVGFEHVTPAQYKAMQAAGQIPQTIQVTSNPASQVTTLKANPSIPFSGSAISRQARRLYVGNIPFGVSESAMMDFFNNQMETAKLAQADGCPIIACQVNLDKNFAFLEFRSVDETSACLVFDGIMYQGQSLKLRRPRDYQPMPSYGKCQYLEGDSVSANKNKLFISEIPKFINAEQIKDLIESFGPTYSFELATEDDGTSKGYAFFEYADPTISDQAIVGLHGMELGDKQLVVQRVVQEDQTITPGIQLQIPGLNEEMLHISSGASEILCLMNMIEESELMDDEEYDDITEDVKNECSKHGTVKSMEIPRPISGVEVPSVGKIFIEFENKKQCQLAQTALAGRKFAGRIVVASFFDPDRYHKRQFE